MTLIGKICTVLIFIMSLVFMSLSLMVYATHQNWRLAVLNPNAGDNNYPERGLKFQIEDAEATNELLREEKEIIQDELEKERATRRMAISQLQSKLDLLQNDLDQKESELAAKIADNGRLMAELTAAQAELANKTDEVKVLRTDVRTALADRDEQFRQVVSLSDNLHVHQREADNLKERRDQLALQITDMKRVMDHHNLTVNTPLHNKPPRVDGQVTEISSKNKNLIEISIGSDDGLRAGHELIVYRDKSYIARIVVRQVNNNAAVAEVVRATVRGIIRKGDNVTTRFG